MRSRVSLILTLALAAGYLCLDGAAQPRVARTIVWDDVAPVRAQLQAAGFSASSFSARIESIRKANERRVHEGDLDHLVFYVLQSTKFTRLQRIEPALSARTFVETGELPANVRERAAAFLRAAATSRGDARLSYFRDVAAAAFPEREAAETGLLREYSRVMRFVYDKEFVAQRSGRRDAAIAELYRTRGLATDTAVEAGFIVADGLAVLRALDRQVRIRRVLIVGPGLDIAPRTGMLETGAPESYQPWAVIDALLALGLSRANDLTVVGADINPRVVQHLRRARGRARTLTLVTGIGETGNVTLSEAFREYFAQLGRHLQARRDSGAAERSEAASAKRARERSERDAGGGGAPPALNNADRIAGHLSKTIRVDRAVARVLDAERLDIVTERLTLPPFDLVIATNLFPYLDDTELLLALTNIASMLAPGGVLLHNEGRPVMEEFTQALGLRLEQSRHSVIATVRDAPPLIDSIWLQRKITS